MAAGGSAVAARRRLELDCHSLPELLEPSPAGEGQDESKMSPRLLAEHREKQRLRANRSLVVERLHECAAQEVAAPSLSAGPRLFAPHAAATGPLSPEHGCCSLPPQACEAPALAWLPSSAASLLCVRPRVG